jgi:hypothetical protein
LTREDRHELSLALAWEGDAYTECFSGTDLLWLENGYQEADLIRRFGMATDTVAESFARGLLDRLRDPCRPTIREWMTNVAPMPEPRSKKALIDLVWRKAWAEASGEPESFGRDARWAKAICERSADLCDGWIAIVVGWVHADPAAGSQRLRGLLLSEGFAVNSVHLGP